MAARNPKRGMWIAWLILTILVTLGLGIGWVVASEPRGEDASTAPAEPEEQKPAQEAPSEPAEPEKETPPDLKIWVVDANMHSLWVVADPANEGGEFYEWAGEMPDGADPELGQILTCSGDAVVLTRYPGALVAKDCRVTDSENSRVPALREALETLRDRIRVASPDLLPTESIKMRFYVNQKELLSGGETQYLGWQIGGIYGSPQFEVAPPGEGLPEQTLEPDLLALVLNCEDDTCQLGAYRDEQGVRNLYGITFTLKEKPSGYVFELQNEVIS